MTTRYNEPLDRARQRPAYTNADWSVTEWL